MTRRIRAVGEAAVPEWVAREARRFQYPDFDTVAPAVAPGGGGGAPTVVVAASDASDLSKSKADFVCTGVSDQEVFATAAAVLPTFGGRLLATEGFFEFDGEFDMPDDITLQGMGRESSYFSGDVSTFLIDMATTSVLRDLAVENFNAAGGGCVDAVSGRSMIHNCYFESFNSAGWGVRKSVASDLSIVSCTFNGTGDGIITTANDGRGLRVVDCLFTGCNRGVFVDGGDAVLILGCEFNDNTSWAIEFDGVVESTILGSFIIQSGTDGNDGGIRLLGCSQVGVKDSLVKDSFQHGLVLEDSTLCTVASTFDANGQLAANTYDDIHLTGDSDRNRIWQSDFFPNTQTRYAVNVSASTCDCNIVVGNDWGDPAGYGTDALNDAGTNTQLFYPADATYGDNFTDCGSPGSP